MSVAKTPQDLGPLVVEDKAALYRAYMPYLKLGGLFVPTGQHYVLGDEVTLRLTLPESGEQWPVSGKVVWVTPPGASGHRTAGIGMQFADSPEGERLKHTIEALLAGALGADKPTQTM